MIQPLYRALGLMSGTSLDGIDAALIETDGYDFVRPLAFRFYPYEGDFRERVRACFGNTEGSNDLRVAIVERELTGLHASAVRAFLDERAIEPENIDFIGFHGQTIVHRPGDGLTIQLGDGEYLAMQSGLPVINDFRSADVKAGGQGAPLVPLYHRALAANLPKPVAVINIGGVSNITWIGGEEDKDMLAFDMGPGNALIDDWMLQHTGRAFDRNGQTAESGTVDKERVERFLRHSFFRMKPPKSLDRDAFRDDVPYGLSPSDGAATLTMMTVKAIAAGLSLLPRPPLAIYLAGGGRHNVTMRRWLEEGAKVPVKLVDDLGWNGDSLEAEAFAYLAVRSKLGLPLTLPGTTGVGEPTSGGAYYTPDSESFLISGLKS